MTRHPKPRAAAHRPSVTVVIPCYNYGHYLPISVGSVLAQPGVDVDLIVIDDASPDGSGGVVRELASSDDRVRGIVHGRNRGHIATYNEGLEQATGDYVVLLSADDALTPGALARATALLEAEPATAFCYGFPTTFVDELPPVDRAVRSWTIWSGREWIELRCRKGINCINCPEVVMRTSVQHRIGGYDAQLPHSGDLEMWLRAAAVGDVGRVNGPAQAFYRVHSTSMQRTIYAGRVNDLEGRLGAFEKVLVGPGSHVQGGDRLYAKARRALAAAALTCAAHAHEDGSAEVEPVDEYVAFAHRVWPATPQLREWRSLQRRAQRRPAGPAGGLMRRSRRLSRDVTRRVRWRRWRWSGV